MNKLTISRQIVDVLSVCVHAIMHSFVFPKSIGFCILKRVTMRQFFCFKADTLIDICWIHFSYGKQNIICDNKFFFVRVCTVCLSLTRVKMLLNVHMIQSRCTPVSTNIGPTPMAGNIFKTTAIILDYKYHCSGIARIEYKKNISCM